MNDHPPEGYSVRPATHDDIPALADMINRRNTPLLGHPTDTVEEWQRGFNAPDFDPATSTRLMLAPDGQIAGFAELNHPKVLPVRPALFFSMAPEHEREDVAAALLAWGIAVAARVLPQVPDDVRVTLEGEALSLDGFLRDQLLKAGFTNKGTAWDKMLIELGAEPEPPAWPDGITLKTHEDVTDLRQIYLATRDSFQDHRGHVAQRDIEDGFKRWQYWLVEDEAKYVPSLWLLAMDGDEIAGVSLCKPKNDESPDEGYVSTLGVRPSYRGRGLGLALLRASFVALWGIGQRKVSLHVDSASITGANRLYLKAGMHAAESWQVFEMVLREGRELSVQGPAEAQDA